MSEVCPYCESSNTEQRGVMDVEDETVDGKLRFRCNACLGQFPVDPEEQ